MNTEPASIRGRFAAALLDPARPLPAGLRAASTIRASSGFAVYRNNVARGLLNVLAARFPVIVRLLGVESFEGLALRFIALHPPRSPVLLAWGDRFPGFLCELTTAPSARYLADIARLELARGHAYHAADAEPVAAGRFAEFATDELPELRVSLHPSLMLLRSVFPIVSAWETNQPGGNGLLRRWCGEDVMVARPRADVIVLRLVPGGFSFLSSLAAGCTLADAIAAGIDDDAGFDIAANLALLAGSGVAVDVR